MQESIERANALLEKADLLTLAVVGEDQYPRAYVMTKLAGEGIRELCFLAKDHSEKVCALELNPRACVSFAAPGGSVSLTGEVKLERDPAAMRALWVPELDRIFPAGPEQGDLVLLRFTARAGTFCFMGKVEDCPL